MKIFLSPSETNFALADADELTAENSAFGLPVAPFQKFSEASSFVPSSAASSSRADGDSSNAKAVHLPQELLDGDVIVNLYSNKKKSQLRTKKQKQSEKDDLENVERLREKYWDALPSSSKGEQDEKLLRKANKYLKKAENGNRDDIKKKY